MESPFYVWATLLTENQAERLMSGLVRRGISVEPLGRDGQSVAVSPHNVAVLCSLKISTSRQFDKNQPHSGASWAIEQVRGVLDAEGGGYFSVIVTDPFRGSAIWNGSNVRRSDGQDAPAQPPALPEAPLNKLDEALDG